MPLPKDPGVLCNKGYPSKTHHKLKCREISFVHNIHLDDIIIFKFWTEHDNTIVMFNAKFQDDWTTETNVMDERGFARFELRWGSADGCPILHSTPD